MPIAFSEPFSFDQALGDTFFSGDAQTEIHTRVLILGAGLAGLTCAHRYAQSLQRPITRNDVLILEREPSVGGRVRSLKIESNVLNLGAVTFQPAAYPRYTALLEELGLRERVHIISRRDMVFGINTRSLYANNLALATDGIRTLAQRGVFTPSEAIQLVRFYFFMRRVTSPAHFDELLALHDRSVAEWAAQFGFSASLKRKFVEPFIAFTFSDPEKISAAFGVLLLGFNLSRPANLSGGMMQLPEALAAKLTNVIETNALALRVERDANGFITHYRQRNQIHRVLSKFLIVALPANVAANLVPEMRERAATMNYGNGFAIVLHGKLKAHGSLRLWRVDGTHGTILYGGEAQSDNKGGHYFNVLTYRGSNALAHAKKLFVHEQYKQLVSYRICPAVAAPQPNQTPLPLDWGDGLFMAGDCTGIFPSQETAVSSGEQVARLIDKT